MVNVTKVDAKSVGFGVLLVLFFMVGFTGLLNDVEVTEAGRTVLLFEVLVCIVFILLSRGMPKKALDRPLLCGVLIFGISSFVSTYLFVKDFPDVSHTYTRLYWVFTLVHFLFFLCLLKFSQKPKRLLLGLSNTLIAIAFCYAMAYLFGHIFNLFPEDINLFRDPPGFAHIRHMGYLIALAAMLALVLLVDASQRSYIGTYLFLAVVVNSFLFWLGGRGAILSVIVGVGFYLLLNFTSLLDFAKRGLTVGLVFAAAILISDLFSIYPWNGAARVLKSFDVITLAVNQSNIDDAKTSGIEVKQLPIKDSADSIAQNDTKGLGLMVNKLSTDRIYMWKISINSLKERALFGWAGRGFSFIEGRLYGSQPHNFVFQWLVQWGALGFLALVFVFTRAFYLGYTSNLAVESKIALSTCVSLLVHSLFDGPLFYSQTLFYFLLFVGIFVLLGADEVSAHE